MVKYLKETWEELGRSIFVGDRYKKNVRGISVGAALIVVINIITGTMNLRNGYHMAAVSSILLITMGLVVLYFMQIKKNRKLALLVATVVMSVIYSFDAIVATDGIIIFWTLLFPWAFCYLVSVKDGIMLSAYFTALYFVLFYTPLHHMVEGKYPDIIIQRFPILYFANAFLCVYIMVQYHKNTLHQMDYAEQLLDAKEAADRANTAKSDFLANMSHEIRTPINAVLGMNEMVLRESLQAREEIPEGMDGLRGSMASILSCAENIDSAGNNLLAIINDILDFSKIESGKMEITDAYYQFSSVLNDVSNMISFKAKDKSLDFIVDVDPEIPDGLYGDEVRVRQVITNILNNAVKYTKEGSVTLSVHMDAAAPVKKDDVINLIVAVKDTGIGIRQEDIGKLFGKFERVDLQQNSTIEGSGLGLAITKNLLNMMHGRVDVESVYGEGSVFTITLPQKVVSAEPVGDFKEKFEKSVREAKAYEESFRAPDAHILIVDDTRMNLRVATGLLKKTEIKIDTAGGGPDAIALCESTKYDLILMDQRMPGMDGTEAMNHIKEQENGANRETSFICLTADAVSGAKKRYIAEGFTDYLSKPIDSKALESMLIKYLPKDKVILMSGNEAGGGGEKTVRTPHMDDGWDVLREAGVDPEVGLRYCQGDGEFYRSLLDEYAQGADEKTAAMQAYYDASDWKNYGVLVHSLKSTSKMLGAAALSEMAAGLEAAANAGDAGKISLEHDAMLEKYQAVLQAIRTVLPGTEGPEADDGEVLEFSPEDDGVLEFVPGE